MTAKSCRKLGVGLAFLAPNIIGFLAFMLLPLVFSLVLAFTNWDIRLHNIFRSEPLKYVGLDNFVRLWHDGDFWRYLGNTLYLMLGVPFGIAGSLGAAVLLSKDLRAPVSRRRAWIVGGTILSVSAACLALCGAGATGMTVLLCGLVGLVLGGGFLCGAGMYRTIFYAPHFTAGVATFILWKHMYNPQTGPVNAALRPVLDGVAWLGAVLPPWLPQGGLWACAAGVVLLAGVGTRRTARAWRDGDTGTASGVATLLLLLLPPVAALRFCATPPAGTACAVVSLILCLAVAGRFMVRGRDFASRAFTGIGQALMLGSLLLTAEFALLGLGNLFWRLPDLSGGGLAPPEWLTDYQWAKPALMIMAFWAAVGSNNMLLYLAGLGNIPPELHEAADIDGASAFQRFWHVTWPQLAPVTFFVVIMSVISGLQGGFEMARTMTEGGPAGSTTTLSYYVYTEGFETGHLGYASAAAWAMFAMVLGVTAFNWKFGNRYVNN